MRLRGRVVDAPPPVERIPLSTDPEPPSTAVGPMPPRDWFHYNAKQAEALDRLERRLTSLEERLGESPAPIPASQEVAAQAVEARYTAPAGVVSPHVALNLHALREWIDVALQGGDVPRP
jgi:hypothetical protein